MSDSNLISALIDYNYQLSKKLEDLVPEYYFSSSLIAEIDDFWKLHIDNSKHSNEYIEEIK